jgi:glycerol-3-phosphate dehydrogenase (NAD(P)+)|tara:strand:- start:1293 stop:2300 length:1008 start_codon:yes stop_codon:yes gene_type:complete
MSKILSIGAGVMGTAITIPAVSNGHHAKIIGTSFDKEIINSINQNSVHPKLNVQLTNTTSLLFNEMTQEDIDESDVIVIGINSSGIDWFINLIKNFNIVNKKFLIVTKGLYMNEKKELDIFPNKIKNEIQQDINLTAVTGPCKAIELAKKNLTNICFVNSDLDTAIDLANLFRNDYYVIKTQTDLLGAEFCAALKNVYAIAVGYSQTFFLKEEKIYNPESALFSHCVNEMCLLVNLMGGLSETVFSLSGLGDLHVTSGTGRNGLLGNLLASNRTYEDIITKELKDETVEGAQTIKDLAHLFNRLVQDHKLPILENLVRCICQNEKLNIPWNDLNI